MIRRPQLTVRRLMKWVGVAAVVLALFRYPYNAIREQQHFHDRSGEGTRLVQSYGLQCPAGESPASWTNAVGSVQTAWCNVVFAPGSLDDADLDAILAEMRAMVGRATPAQAEGDLYLILDLLAHVRTKSGVHYLSMMRDFVRNAMPGQGRPSPGLVDYAFSQAGPKPGETPLAAITAGLQAGDWRVRVTCCRALGQYGLGLRSPTEADAALVGLIHAIDNEDPLVREIAVECCHEMETKAARAAQALIERLEHDSSRRVRWQAARTLTVIEEDKKAAIPALIAAIGDEESAVGETALSALAALGREAREALPALRKALQDRDDGIRKAATAAIARVGPPAEVAVPALIDMLEHDPSESVRREATIALAGLGPEASAALPALIVSLERDDDPNERNGSAATLARVAPTDPRTTASLARALKREGTFYIRRGAAEALGQIGPPAAAAIPSLTDSLKDPEDTVRTAAEEALGKIRARP